MWGIYPGLQDGAVDSFIARLPASAARKMMHIATVFTFRKGTFMFVPAGYLVLSFAAPAPVGHMVHTIYDAKLLEDMEPDVKDLVLSDCSGFLKTNSDKGIVRKFGRPLAHFFESVALGAVASLPATSPPQRALLDAASFSSAPEAAPAGEAQPRD